MIGLDTNVLVRYYMAAETNESQTGDAQADKSLAATVAQSETARALIDGGKRLMVSKTVVLELEWVLRGYYSLTRQQVAAAFAHLLSMAHIQMEDKVAVQSAVAALALGFDFADALHHASYSQCTSVATFDDRGFARRAKKAGWKPAVALL
jgi:predicted nucleic-acid-binding protein